MHQKSIFLTTTILLALIISSCGGEQPVIQKLKIIVTVDESIKNDQVYISGDARYLGEWDAGKVKLDRLNDTQWAKTFDVVKGEKIWFKFTAGDWWREATDKSGLPFQDYPLVSQCDTTINVKLYGWLNDFSGDTLKLSASRFFPGKRPVDLNFNGKFNREDNPKWALPDLDDRNWKKANSLLLPDSSETKEWKGAGWFRFNFIIDSTLYGKTLGLSLFQLGRSDVYYNGRLIHPVNTASKADSRSETWLMTEIKELQLDRKREHLIAVRYENHDQKNLTTLNFDAGFIMRLFPLEETINKLLSDTKRYTFNQTFFSLVPFILFILHFFLYVFYPGQRQNLFYSLSLLGLSGVTWFGYEKQVVTDPSLFILYFRLNSIAVPFAVLFGLFSSWSICRLRFPKRWVIYVAGFTGLAIWAYLRPVGDISIANYVFFGISMADLGYSILKSDIETSRKGGWISFAGFAVLVFFVGYQILLDYRFIDTPFFGTNQVYVYGVLGLIAAMSLYLSYNFAYVNKDLKIQLENVKSLSEKALEQERIAAGLELERRLIEAENARQSKELESARELQLSLLPKKIPEVPGLEIAVYLQTATEVGGDYYDFFPQEDGSLTIAVGDATGHGLKAGNMVIATKGLLNVLSGKASLLEMIKRANIAIKNMNLKMLTMCLSLVNIKNGILAYTSAGMPPILIFRKNSGEVESHIIKAMPLGGVTDFPYSMEEIEFGDGDALVVMSDGLMELFNGKDELWGIESIQSVLCNAGTGNAEQILSAILESAGKWKGETALKDDLTLVVVKQRG